MKSNDARAFALSMLNSSFADEEIVPYLDALVQQGYGGACPHPRDGLRVPYLTRAFWKGIERFIELARERDLAVWFYDEFPFPSGMAGGIVVEEMPDGCIRSLEFKTLDTTLNSDGLIEVGDEMLVALLRIDGETVTDVSADSGPYLDTWVWGEWHNRFYTGTINVHDELHERGVADRYTRAYLPETPLRPDEKLVAVHAVRSNGRRGQVGMPDVSRPEVTARFLELTYKPYSDLAKKFELGDVPVFQDEVTFGAPWPWNRYIEARLRTSWGEDFATNLAAIGEIGRTNWESARVSYRAACRDQLEAGWFGQVQEYCAANGLRATGHLPGEETMHGHSHLMADAFVMLRRFDVPGYDIISSTLPDGKNRGQATGAKIVQSSAWRDGKSTMVEAFGANGWHLDNQKSRSILAWLACHDLVRVFDHSAYISANGPRKYDAPPLSTRFNPMSVGRAELWGWHAWLCDLFDEYRFTPRTLVLFPVESLMRYTLLEEERWKDQASLLETWFHTLCVASLDCVFLPADQLHEVEATANGFRWNGQNFDKFLVPPVVSMHEATLAALEPFAQNTNFHWYIQSQAVQSTVEFDRTLLTFGAHDGKATLSARNLSVCTVVELLQIGAEWFAELSPSDDKSLISDDGVLQTVRRNSAGEALRVAINPHNHAATVRWNTTPGEVLSAPDEVAAELVGNGYTLAPREILVWRDGAQDAVATQPNAHRTVAANSARVRFVGDNALSLSEGRAHLSGESERDFRPEPVSSLWNLGVPMAESDAVFAAPYSRAKLTQPRPFSVEFPVELREPIETLAVVIDSDSLPPKARVSWNGVVLQPQTRAVFDTLNTVFEIPPSGAGTYALSIEAEVTRATHGVLERPVLVGRFLVFDGALHAMPTEWQTWDGASFAALGVPEGFGPLEYEWTFEVESGAWQIELPNVDGVAEVWANERFVGRSNWEPRRLALGALAAGEVVIRTQLHGSWNNVFSKLNRVENGFTSHALLREA